MHLPDLWGWVGLFFTILVAIAGIIYAVKPFVKRDLAGTFGVSIFWIGFEISAVTATGMIIGAWDNWTIFFAGLLVSLIGQIWETEHPLRASFDEIYSKYRGEIRSRSVKYQSTNQAFVGREVVEVRFSDGSIVELGQIVKQAPVIIDDSLFDTLVATGPVGAMSYRFLRDVEALDTTGVSRWAANALSGR